MPDTPDIDLPAHVELLVLGSGSAASKVATSAAEAGKQVALVENRDFGGTCALRGCNPKKVMTRAAELVDLARTMSGKYLPEDASPSLDWNVVRAGRAFPSLFEGAAKSVLEAMACGACVVAGNHGGMKDTIIHGETGWLCENGSVDDYVRHCLAMLDDGEQAARIGRAAMQPARQLTWSLTAERMVAFFRELSDAKARAGELVG